MSHLPSLTSNPHLHSIVNQHYGSFSSSGNRPLQDAPLALSIEPQTQLEASMRMINSEFATLGYSSVLFNDKDRSNININSLIENTLKILESHFRELSVRAESESRVHTLEAELAHLHRIHRRCQDDLNEAQRCIAAAKERDRRSEEEKRSLNSRLKVTTDELRKMQLCFNRYEVQSAHERRKLEHEVVHLRERLSAILYKSTNHSSPSRFTSRSSGLASMAKLSTSLLALGSTGVSGLDRVPKRASASSSQSLHVRTRPNTRVNARYTLTSSSSATNGQDSSSVPIQSVRHDMMSVSIPEGSSQADLYTTVIRQLEERQHSLFYENRELRDLVGQISSRLVRCTRFIDNHQSSGYPSANTTRETPMLMGGDFDSMDEDEDDEPRSFRPDSSDDETGCLVNNHEGTLTQRRKSTDVNELLLQLPYALVRDRLTQRVRQLSRDLWRRLKQWIGARSMKAVAKEVNIQESLHTDPLNGHPISSANTDPPADEHDNLQLTKEVIELRNLVVKYEAQIAEQQIALRRALFSNSRRWNGYSRGSLLSQDGSSDQSVSCAPTRSFESTPQHRISPFKVTQLPIFPAHEEDISQTSNIVVVPTDGAGDRACDPTNMADEDVFHSKAATTGADRKFSGTVVIQRETKLNRPTIGSDTSGGGRRDTATHRCTRPPLTSILSYGFQGLQPAIIRILRTLPALSSNRKQCTMRVTPNRPAQHVSQPPRLMQRDELLKRVTASSQDTLSNFHIAYVVPPPYTGNGPQTVVLEDG